MLRHILFFVPHISVVAKFPFSSTKSYVDIDKFAFLQIPEGAILLLFMDLINEC